MGLPLGKPIKYSAVVAIDFGTSYSGYAFSYRREKDVTHLNTNWGAEVGAESWKTPTSVLYKQAGGKLDAFGFESEHIYFEEIEKSKGKNERPVLFRSFKMQLYGQEHLGHRMMLKSYNELDEEPALDVFADALRFIKNHAMARIEIHHGSPIDEKKSPIRWVVTVPAIWTDKQKIFMREACVKAGLIKELNSRHLIIALEPECASLYCRKLSWDKFVGLDREKQPKIDNGTTYMVVDLGGGTVDITVHKITGDKIVEVIPVNGGPWGGYNINVEFGNLLAKALGKGFVAHLLEQKPAIWPRMMIDFEKAKKGFKEHNAVWIPLQYGLGESYIQYKSSGEIPHRGSIRDILTGDTGIHISDNGNLVIEGETMRDFFGKVVDNIYELVFETFKSCPKGDTPKYIFLVGGFSECPHVQTKIKTMERVCPSPKPMVLVPHESSLCVLRGAVVFGHNPDTIKARMSRYTYAFLTERPFVEGKDDPRRIKMVGSKRMVEYLETIVSMGTSVEEGFYKEREIRVAKDKKSVPITVYTSTLKKVENPNEPNVKELGSVIIKGRTLKGKQHDRLIKVFFVFGKTELEVRALDTSTNEEVVSNFGFEGKDDNSNCSVM